MNTINLLAWLAKSIFVASKFTFLIANSSFTSLSRGHTKSLFFLLPIDTTSEPKMNQFLESIGAFFGGGDQIPWCDPDIIVVIPIAP